MIRLLLALALAIPAALVGAAEDRVVDLGDSVMVYQVGGPDAAVGKNDKAVIVKKANVILKMTKYKDTNSWSLYAPGAGESPYISLNGKTAYFLMSMVFPKLYELSADEQKAMGLPWRDDK